MNESKKAVEKMKRKAFSNKIQEEQVLQKIQKMHFYGRNMIGNIKKAIQRTRKRKPEH
ncbi:putative WD repeat-containing protein 87-like [Sesbania bispinosa]|nr:putative WD repeat-containing protein 87-like [Sesbania bispinosa]